MRILKKKEHSVSCAHSIQSASFPDDRHLFQHIYYTTSAETDSTVTVKSHRQKMRYNYVKNKQRA